MNIVLFLAIYCIISITLSSLYTYKDRCIIHQSFHKPPPNKMQWQTLLEIFLLHIFTIAITIAILPYMESNEITAEDIAFGLSIVLAVLYEMYYITNRNICAGVDFMLNLIMIGLLNIPIRHLKLFEGLYYKAWIKSSGAMFLTFTMFFCSMTVIFYLAYRIFPNTRERIKQLWDEGDSNEK